MNETMSILALTSLAKKDISIGLTMKWDEFEFSIRVQNLRLLDTNDEFGIAFETIFAFQPCMCRARLRQTEETVCIKVRFFLLFFGRTEIKFISSGMITPRRHMAKYIGILCFQPIYSEDSTMPYACDNTIRVQCAQYTDTLCVYVGHEHTRHSENAPMKVK